jgi:hypothetical protein
VPRIAAISPQLPDREAYRLRIWLPGRLGDHELRVCHIVLSGSADARLTPDFVIGIGGEPTINRRISDSNVRIPRSHSSDLF